MNNRSRGRGKKRKCPSKVLESNCSQEGVLTNNEEFKQTESQIRVVPSFNKKKKVANPAHEKIPEYIEGQGDDSNYNRQEEIEGCYAPDKSPLHPEHVHENETEAGVSHQYRGTEPRDIEVTVNTEAAASCKRELLEKEDQHPGCSHAPNTLQAWTRNEQVGGTTHPQAVECSTNKTDKTAALLESRSFANVAEADKRDFTGETCGGVDRCGHVSDVMSVPALTDEAENVSWIPSEQCIQECKSSETDDEDVKQTAVSVEKVEDMQAHVEMEGAARDHTDQTFTSEVKILPIQVKDTNPTVAMGADINESKENRKGRKCVSLNADVAISDDPEHASDSAEEFSKTSDPSSVDKSITKEQEVYESTSVEQLTDSKKSVELQQCQSVVSRETGEVIAPEIIPSGMTTGGDDESAAAKKDTEAGMLAVTGSEMDAEVDFTDSQLCEAVSIEESANQLLVLQEVHKQRLEGRKIIHDLIVDLSHLNKLVLRTKREIETARRKRQPQSCVQNRVTTQNFHELRKF